MEGGGPIKVIRVILLCSQRFLGSLLFYRFRQILFNLISNAMKFTLEGGTVTVVVKDNEGCCTSATDESSLQTDSSMVSVDVIDMGIGMSPETMEHLFGVRFCSMLSSLVLL